MADQDPEPSNPLVRIAELLAEQGTRMEAIETSQSASNVKLGVIQHVQESQAADLASVKGEVSYMKGRVDTLVEFRATAPHVDAAAPAVANGSRSTGEAVVSLIKDVRTILLAVGLVGGSGGALAFGSCSGKKVVHVHDAADLTATALVTATATPSGAMTLSNPKTKPNH